MYSYSFQQLDHITITHFMLNFNVIQQRSNENYYFKLTALQTIGSSYLIFLGRTLFCRSAVCSSTRRSYYRPSTLRAPKTVGNTAMVVCSTALL